MTSRPRRTTTLSGPNRIVVGAATAGLVALASAGTALVVLTGTSSVAPLAAPAPPLPTSTPLTRAPGVVVLPATPADRLAGQVDRAARQSEHGLPLPLAVPTAAALPLALAFTADVPDVPSVVDRPTRPALTRAPAVSEDRPALPGRRLAKGHVKNDVPKKHTKHPKLHGIRLGWAHSLHLGNR